MVHADEDAAFVDGELLPMLGLPEGRVLRSSELPFPAFIEQAIAASVRRSRLTLAVVSPAYLRDRWAGFAELLARNLHDDGSGGSLVPLLLADCDVPDILAQHAMLDCRTPPSRAAAATRLRERLGLPAPADEPIACPYPGMRPFTAAIASRFHGRAGEIAELVGRIYAGERDLYVIGPSGSGKSSLIAAGLIPRLIASDRDGRFAVRTVRPGERPMQRLVEALACDLDGVAGAVARLLERETCERLLVFIDQLEELFAQADAGERERFVRALGVLRADRRCHQILALRADFYGALMSSALWADIEGRFTRLEVGPLRRDAMREAIVAPARHAGASVEAALVDRLVDDAATEPGALPLLQEALVVLWEARSHRLLRLASYEALGSEGRSGLAVALARRADAVLHDLAPAQQRLAQRIFLRLVSFGDDRPDTRRQQPRAALAASGDDARAVDAVLDRLIEDRMLTTDATAGGAPLVDLAHEALITGWPELQRWLLARRDDEQHRRLLELHAAEWARRGRGVVGLFDAVELGEAERWIAGDTAREIGYSDELSQFLAASRAAIDKAERHARRAREDREREQRSALDERMRLRRRLARFAVAALAISSIVASALGLVAWRARNAARREWNATRVQLGLNEQERARSLLLDGHDPEQAMPHLLQAIKLGIDNAVLRTLLAEARHVMWRVTVRHGGSVRTASFSADGSRILTVRSDGTARLSDAHSGAAVGDPLTQEGRLIAAAFDLEGSRVFTVEHDGTVRMWDAATGAAVGGMRRVGDPGETIAMAEISPDGSRIVTARVDGTARVWDLTTGAAVGGPLVHHMLITAAAFSPDGSRIVTASGDGTARVWDATTGVAITSAHLREKHWFHSAAFSPDGSRIVTADLESAWVWDADTGTPLAGPLHSSVLDAVFSPDGARIVTASGDGTARIWDAATGDSLGSPLEHDSLVNSAVFSPDGERIVTASGDGTMRIWDERGTLVAGPFKHRYAVNSAAFGPDGSLVVTASDDGTARLWDTTVDSAVSNLLVDGPVKSAAFSADALRVVTANWDGTARVWDAATGAATSRPLEHGGIVYTAAFSPDGTRIITASKDGTARLWNSVTGTAIGDPLRHGSVGTDRSRIVKSGPERAVCVPGAITLPGEADPAVNGAVRVPDGFRVATAGSDGDAYVRDAVRETSCTSEIEVLTALFSPDGTRIVTTGKDCTARLWDGFTGAAIATPLLHDDWVYGAAFSPDGTRVVTASRDDTARIWNAVTGAAITAGLEHDGSVMTAGFSSDGTRVVTASADGTVRVWNAVTGATTIGPFRHDLPVATAVFGPDGSRIVTAGFDNTARIWDAAADASTAGPLRHASIVNSAAFSPDGSRIITASDDSTARIWDAATGAAIASPIVHEGSVNSAAFSPDGSKVLTGSADGTARVSQVLETGPLVRWVEQAGRCVIPKPDALVSSVQCPLQDRTATPSSVLAMARSMMRAGDASPFVRVSRGHYRRAIERLDRNHDALARVAGDELKALWATISQRLAMLDAVEGHLQDARSHIGPGAPAADADLLDELATLAHDETGKPGFALSLWSRAHEFAPRRPDLVARLAEQYFVARRYDDFARAAAQANQLSATPSDRVALAALGWAVARLTRTSTTVPRARLMAAFSSFANGALVLWTWTGTRHAIKYGHFRHEDVRPILDVLQMLEQRVTVESRAQLARLLADGKQESR
ncbi:MAG TPA: TIR domain-containing protein [Kofleriaceae bacterium]|nr:TIR domain-containing protein [Kofleriaceae bacterium]